MKENEKLLFVSEAPTVGTEGKPPWKVLIADDEEEVHAVTRMVLNNFTFEGRGLALFSSYSGNTTKQLITQHPDIAVILLDVVMEEENTGLAVVRYIREELKNNFVRIVLRTGQPGQAPERNVTMEYDINDYKEKTELTAQKLFTTMIGLLRSYRDLRVIEKQRQGLERITSVSRKLFEFQSLKQFATGLLQQLAFLLNMNNASSARQLSGFVAQRRQNTYSILSGIGQFSQAAGSQAQQVILEQEYQYLLRMTGKSSTGFYADNVYIGHFCTRNGVDNVLYLHTLQNLDHTEKDLINVFASNLTVAFDNIDLNEAILETQREVIFVLGKVVEKRSLKAEHHVQRVAAYSYLLALKAGLNEDTASMIKLASPMHDVGKFSVPDTILSKQEALTQHEFEIIRKHPIVGYNILKGSKQKLLKAAAIIALQHHERWDGKGYPQGLCGDDIHIFARITKLADAFAKLTHKHTLDYPGDNPDMINQFTQQLRAEQKLRFDPDLVSLLVQNIEEFLTLHIDTHPS